MPTIASGPRRTDTGPQLPYSIRAETTWSFPQNVSGLSVWFDASDATTINSIGSNLLSWRSKDSNAIIMSNGNYPLGPTFIQNARNGLPVVRFDGTNNSFISSIVTNYNSSNFTLNNQTTMFLAYNRTNAGAPFNIVDTASRGGGGIRLQAQGGSFFYGNIFSNNGRLDFTVTNDTTLGFRIDSFYAYSQTIGFRLSGSTYATSNLPTPTSFPTNVPLIVQMGGLNLGGRLFTQDLGEVILYNRGLSDTEIASIEAYLAKKWATTAAFPVGHVGRTTFNTRMGFRFLTYSLPVATPFIWYDVMDTSNLATTFLSFSNGFIPNNNDFVGSIRDKGVSSANLATPSPYINRYPQFSMFGLTRYPTLQFITNQRLTSTGLSYTGNSFDFFVVCNLRSNVNSGNQVVSIIDSGNSFNPPGNQGIGLGLSNGTLGVYRSNFYFNTPYSLGTNVLVSVFVNGSNSTLGGILPSNTTMNINGAWANSISTLTRSNFNLFAPTMGGIPVAGNIIGNISEWICFARSLTTTERLAMENQLLAKWQIGRDQPVAYLATGVPVTRGLQMWYDAYLPAFVTTNASNHVTSWLDRSGNGFHMSNAGLNPVVYTTLTGQTASLPALQFTFSNATSNFSALQNFNISNFVTSTITTIATGFFTQNPVSGLASRILSLGSTINAFEQIHNSVLINQIYNQCNLSGNYTQSNFQIRTFLANAGVTSNGSVGPSNMIYYINGSNPSSCNFTYQGMLTFSNARIGASLFNINDLTIGAVRTGQGFFTEILVWNRCLTTAELGSVHTYLFNKWSIVSNAPVASVPVTAGINLWLDAYDSAQVVRDSGGNVWVWRDKSGCNFHFSNNGSFGAQVLRPTYSTTAVGGLPGVLFFSDGSNQRTSLSCLNISYPITPNLSAFVVFQQRSDVSANARLISFTSNTDGTDFNFTNGFALIHTGTTTIGVNRSNTIPGAGGTNTVPNLVSVIFNGSSTTIPDVSISNVGIGRNGVISVNSSNGSLQANFRFNQGWLGTRNNATDTSSYYDGFLSEIILYNRTVTFAERQQIESYLLNKWNI